MDVISSENNPKDSTEMDSLCEDMESTEEETLILSFNPKYRTVSYGGSSLGKRFLMKKINIIKSFYEFCTDKYFCGYSSDAEGLMDVSRQIDFQLNNHFKGKYNRDSLESNLSQLEFKVKSNLYQSDYKNSECIVETGGNLINVQSQTRLKLGTMLNGQKGESEGNEDPELKGTQLIYLGDKILGKGDNPFICPQCGKTFSLASAFHRHQESHCQQNELECKVCLKSFYRSDDLKRHSFVHIEQGLSVVCPFCDKQFFTKTSLRNHMFIHVDLFKCNICKESFLSEQELSDHVIMHHSQTGLNFEILSSENKKDLITKIMEAPDQNSNIEEQNTECEDAFIGTSDSEMKFSGNIDTSFKDIESLSGTLTPMSFQSNSTLGIENNRNLKKDSVKSPFICKLCGTTFTMRSNLLRHIKLHNRARPVVNRKAMYKDEDKPWVCECGKRFTRRNNLLRHKKFHQGDLRHECDICMKLFVRTDDLKEHRRRHFTGGPIPCSICGRRFKTKKFLKRHMLTHNQSEVCTCGVCGTFLSSKADLKKHLSIHKCNEHNESAVIEENLEHVKTNGQIAEGSGMFDQQKSLARTTDRFKHNNESEGTEQFSSKECLDPSNNQVKNENDEIKDRLGMDKNMVSVPAVVVDREKSNDSRKDIQKTSLSWICDICGKSFTLKCNLNRHKVSHTGEKAYKCNVCDKRFSRSDDCKYHIRKHCNSAPSVCILCGLSFTSDSKFKYHLLSHETTK